MKIIKIENIVISIFLLNILFIQVLSNYVILPFNSKKINSSSFISETNYYTLLSIGQPQKTIEIYLILNQYNFYLGKGLCQLNSFSDYLPYESESFKNYSDYEHYVGDIKNATNATENYILYINDLDLKQNISIKDMQFYYGISRQANKIDYNEKICGIIGFNIYYMNQKYKDNYFTYILKQKNITSSYSFSFIFYNNYTKNIFSKNNQNNNYLIIGMNETEIQKLFNTNDLRTVTVTKTVSSNDWRITIDEIFLNCYNYTNKNIEKKILSSNIIVTFDNKFDYIIAQKSDFALIQDYFFKEYIEKNICTLNLESYNYYISCDINFKSEINKFPDINFMIRDINFTFTLTYEDLFIEFNQKIYFMLVNELFHTYYWTLGNIFLKKFPLIFDYDKKIITLINLENNIDKVKDSKFDIYYLLFIIGGICVTVGISFGVIFGKIMWDKNRKKRANELADDYEYITKEDNDKEQRLFENDNEKNN